MRTVGGGACVVGELADEAVTGALTRREREHGAGRRRPDRLLGRIAAKRAVQHSLARSGIDVPLGAVEVVPGAGGRPVVRVDGRSVDPWSDRADPAHGPTTVVSISHLADRAVAVAVAQPAGGPGWWLVGLDIARRDRVAGWAQDDPDDRLRRRILTDAERDAERWAGGSGLLDAVCAKEAVGKVLKCTHPSVRWHDVTVDPSMRWRGAGSSGRCWIIPRPDADDLVCAVAERWVAR